jgi:hypothetical protein
VFHLELHLQQGADPNRAAVRSSERIARTQKERFAVFSRLSERLPASL